MKIGLTIFSLLCSVNLYSQSVTFTINKPKEVKLAEPFYLEYHISNPKNANIAISTNPLNNSDFTLLKIIKSKTSTVDIFKLEIIPFNIGISTIPALEFTFSLNSSSYTALSPEIPLEIKPLFKGELKLKDIYPPFSFPDWFKILIIFIIITTIAYLIYQKIKRDLKNAGRQSFLTSIEAKTPYQAALEEITKLIDLDLISKGEFKLFYTRLSDILRIYLEKEFHIQAMYMTTKDIMKNTSNILTDIKNTLSLREFLDRCDAVKFAKYIPEKDKIGQDIENLKHLLNTLDVISLAKKNKNENLNLKGDKGNVF